MYTYLHLHRHLHPLDRFDTVELDHGSRNAQIGSPVADQRRLRLVDASECMGVVSLQTEIEVLYVCRDGDGDSDRDLSSPACIH